MDPEGSIAQEPLALLPVKLKSVAQVLIGKNAGLKRFNGP